MNARQLSAVVLVMGLCTLVLSSSPSPQSASTAQAKDIVIDEDDQNTTIECKGASITVNGDDNKLTLKDDCNKLTVQGDDNRIKGKNVAEVSVFGDDNKIDVEIVGKIGAIGDDNEITWKQGAGGRQPEVSNTGDDNKIRQDR